MNVTRCKKLGFPGGGATSVTRRSFCSHMGELVPVAVAFAGTLWGGCREQPGQVQLGEIASDRAAGAFEERLCFVPGHPDPAVVLAVVAIVQLDQQRFGTQ